jgi:Bacterial PH domain
MKAVPRSPERAAEHEFEAQFGLPEQLPAGETLLWQGQPLPGQVARRIFHVPALIVYFALMLMWRVAVLVHDGQPLFDALRSSLVLLLLAGTAVAMVVALARLTASTTVYTLTDRRIVMRIGIVLTVTYNLPLRSIDAANLRPLGDGAGDIALTLKGDTRIAYLHLWPHARPWQLTRPQPMLRGLANAEAVARQLAAAWAVANAQPAQPVPAAASPVSTGSLPMTPSRSAA